MAGFLGTLFTGRVALNLALPDPGSFNQAASVFGKGLHLIFSQAKPRLTKHLSEQNEALKTSIDTAQALQDKGAIEGHDAVKKQMAKSNQELAKALGIDDLAKYHRNLQSELGANQTTQQLNAALMGEAGAQMLDNEDIIQNKIDTAIKNLSFTIERFASDTVNRFQDGLYQMTFALIGFYYQLNVVISTVRDFEEQLINAQSIFQTTTEELFAISDELVKFSLQYGISVNETTKVLYQMASAGLTAAESQAILNDVLKLSMATQGDTNTLGKLTIQTIKGFGMEMSDSAELTDKFAFAINKSLIEWQDLASSVKFAMPFFTATGQSVDQLLGSIQVLTNRALEAGIAGRGLRQALAQFAESIGDTTTKMHELGVQIVDEQGNMLQLTDIATNFSDVMGDDVVNNTELLTTLLEDLNVRGATAFVHLVQNADEFQHAVDDLANSAGAATTMAEIQQQSLNREIQLVKNALLAPFLLADETFVAQGYLNEFHMTLHNVVETLRSFVFEGEEGSEVLTEFGFVIREMAVGLLEKFAGVFERLIDIFYSFYEAGTLNLDLLKLYFYPLNTVLWILERVPESMGQVVLGLYLMNKFLPISTALNLLFSDSMWAVVSAASAEFTALGLVLLPLAAMVTTFIVLGYIFDKFGGKIAAVVTGIMVLVAAVLMFKAALNPADAALSFKAMIWTGAAVGAVAAMLIKSIPQGTGTMDIDTAYEGYLSSVEGGGGIGAGGAGSPSAQTLIVDRANFRSDNLSDVDYDSMIRT